MTVAPEREARQAAAEHLCGVPLHYAVQRWVDNPDWDTHREWRAEVALAALIIAQRAPLDARIAELELQVERDRLSCELSHVAEETAEARGREAGRAEERRDVVAWLQGCDDHISDRRADAIEEGAHVGAAKEAGDAG